MSSVLAISIKSFLLFLILAPPIAAEELEIRAYQIDPSFLLHQSIDDDNPFDDQISEQPTKLEAAPFESRFFRKGDSLSDWTAILKIGLKTPKLAGSAIYNKTSGRFVLQTTSKIHSLFHVVGEEKLIQMPRLTVEVHRAPIPPEQLGKSTENRLPKGAKSLASVSCLAGSNQPFTMQTTDSKIRVDAQIPIAKNQESSLSTITINSEIPDAEFSLETGIFLFPGEPVFLDLGSTDGKSAVILTITLDSHLPDGTSAEDWVLHEDEDSFLTRDQLKTVWDPETQKFIHFPDVQRISVQRTFPEFMEATRNPQLYAGNDPALRAFKKSDLLDLSMIYRKFGIEVREKDFVVYHKRTSELYVKLDEANMELSEGFLMMDAGGYPRNYRISFTRCESSEKITNAESLPKDASFVSIFNFYGNSLAPEKMTFGKDLALEVELSPDATTGMANIYTTLAGTGKDLENPDFKTGFRLQPGKPLIIHQTKTDGLWRAWIAAVDWYPFYSE